MKFDVAIVGGGSAGLAAAIGAARTGAEVALLEKTGKLGGMATSAMVHSICGLYLLRDSESEQIRFANSGFPKEFAETLMENGGARGPLRLGRLDVLMHHPPAFAKVAEQMVSALPNIKVFLRSEVSEVHRNGLNRVESLSFYSAGSPLTLEIAAIIDTTGDAEVFQLASAGYERSPLEMLQRPAYICGIGDVVPESINDEGRMIVAHTLSRGVSGGRLSDGALGTAFRSGVLKGDLWMTIDLQGEGFDPNEATCTHRLQNEGKALACEVIEFLKQELSAFEKASITTFPDCLGVRESRRATGLYQLTGEDILEGRRFADEVALAAWPIELRETARGPRFRFPEGNRPCGIPLRSLQSRVSENLFVAGRCISTTHEAQAAVRVIGTCLATGEAAGKAAAKLVSSGSNS